MRAESRCPTATAETASVRPKRSKECGELGALSGIWTRADGSEVGVGRTVVTRGRWWFLWCNLAYCALGEPAQGYGEQGRQAALLNAGWSTGAQEIIHGIDQSSPQDCEIDRCQHNVLV